MFSRYLTYLISFGQKYHDFTRMAISSIIKIGGWQDDIVILSDIDTISGCENIETINVTDDLIGRYPWLAGRTMTGIMPMCLKSEVGHYINLDRYDYVLYLDSDILINSDRLTRIVAGLRRESAFAVQQDCVPISSGETFAGGQILSEEERRKWGDYAINAGIIGFSTDSFGRQVISQWRDLNTAHLFHADDQANLIGLLLRNYQNKWRYIGDSRFGRELRSYPHTFLHFATLKDTLMANYYTQVLGLE